MMVQKWKKKIEITVNTTVGRYTAHQEGEKFIELKRLHAGTGFELRKGAFPLGGVGSKVGFFFFIKKSRSKYPSFAVNLTWL